MNFWVVKRVDGLHWWFSMLPFSIYVIAVNILYFLTSLFKNFVFLSSVANVDLEFLVYFKENLFQSGDGNTITYYTQSV